MPVTSQNLTINRRRGLQTKRKERRPRTAGIQKKGGSCEKTKREGEKKVAWIDVSLRTGKRPARRRIGMHNAGGKVTGASEQQWVSGSKEIK